MSLYELTYVIRSDLDDEGLTGVQDRVAGRLSDAHAETVKSEAWGRRRLAYSIEGIKEGFYFTSILRMPGEDVRPFENQLKLIPEVLRFLIIRQEERNINLNGSLLPTNSRPAVQQQAAAATESQPTETEGGSASDAVEGTETPGAAQEVPPAAVTGTEAAEAGPVEADKTVASTDTPAVDGESPADEGEHVGADAAEAPDETASPNTAAPEEDESAAGDVETDGDIVEAESQTAEAQE